jgi:hypothetical protein
MRVRNGKQADMMPQAGSITVQIMTKAPTLEASPPFSVVVNAARVVLGDARALEKLTTREENQEVGIGMVLLHRSEKERANQESLLQNAHQ